MTEDQVRATLTLVASMMLPQVAAEQPKLQNAVEALVQFISKPGTLTVTVKSTGANGLGIFDLGCRLRQSDGSSRQGRHSGDGRIDRSTSAPSWLHKRS